MTDVAMTATVIPPGALARMTGQLRRLPDRSWMTHAWADGEALEVVRQVIEEHVTGSPDHDGLLIHATVRNPHPYPVTFDRLAVEL